VDAILLVDRHLVFFQVEVGEALLENTNQELVGKLIPIGEAGGSDGLKAAEEVLVGFVALGDGGK